MRLADRRGRRPGSAAAGRTACRGVTVPSCSAPGDGERLEGRARLVGEADGAVLRARSSGAAPRRVGVDARPVGQREHLAGVRVHDDRGRALRAGTVAPTSASTRSTLSWMAASIVSSRRAPGLAGLVSRIEIDSPERVLDQAPLAVGALQQLVVGVLDAAQAVAVGADRAQQLAGEVLARIDAPVRRGQRRCRAASSFCTAVPWLAGSERAR